MEADKELIIVRHGETDWNRQFRYQGNQDIELNERGYKQAERLSQYLSQWRIEEVYSSDLKRAYDTALKVAAPHQLEVKKIKGLREMNFGRWEGLNLKEIEERYPVLFKKWYDDPLSNCPPEGEYLGEFQARVVNAFQKIIKSKRKSILVVAHGGTIRVFLSHILQIPLSENWKLEIGNTGVSVIRFYDGSPVLAMLNYQEHLSDL